ncbi:MAG: hypothetical protein UR61_C0039G0005 [candidate division WS6 bacterium GW2011_GWE1_34_7]|uniref:Uncharacterized protein n=1 Tax=candidate division WS6 bacterium GW2011_GWE1_34_7 TaxID=1619093 RepID=A0A0G0B5Z5_9BACT|nr:MAG: hypothetical protein UR61_C0039G0005 [candidate division WS6 bacterium GW2011_GWE1_34_7]
MLSFNDYLNLIKTGGIFRQKIKLELLRYSDMSPYKVITSDIVNGSGSFQIERKNGVRRNFSCDLINSTIDTVAKYTPSFENNILIPRDPMKLYLGLVDENGNEYFYSCGIFFLTDPTSKSLFSESVVSINLSDAFSLLDGTIGGELDSTYIINLDTNIYTAVNSILQSECNYPLPCILDSQYASEVTPYTLTTEAGNNFSDILTDLTLMLSGNIFFDRNGFLRLEKDTNDAEKGSIFDFTNEDPSYQGAENKYDYTKFYNSMLIVGQNCNDGTIYSAEVSDISLSSPTSINNIGFKRQKRIEDENISSDELCNDRGVYELKRITSLINEVTISYVPFLYHLDVDQVCTLTDANLGFNKERLLITNITIPMDINSAMTIKCVKAIDLPYNEN